MENVSSEQELLELLKEGKISEDEYNELLEAMRKRPPSDSQCRSNFARRYLLWAGVSVVVIIAGALLLPIAISPKVKEHECLTISKVYWFHSDGRPSSIPVDSVREDNDGHMLFHVEEWFEEIGTAEQYRPFLNSVDKRFILKAEGYPDVHASAERGCWSQEFYVRIPAKEYALMREGVPYMVYPVNSSPKYQWKVVSGVTIRKLDE
ncbi:MAG: hypothetical protein JSV99_05265 [Planctomycetota bacterium]|nr:MAG: hypothetical protein JSV99_05265 [Planctomycetota bacterium]